MDDPAGSHDANGAVTGRHRVLVIDDEPWVAAALARVLSRSYEVESTTKAGDAIDRVDRGQRYVAILCDVCMPDLSGVEFHDEVARRSPALAHRIVFMTGGVTDPAVAHRLRALPNAVLSKPFDRVVVERAVANLVCDEGCSATEVTGDLVGETVP